MSFVFSFFLVSSLFPLVCKHIDDLVWNCFEYNFRILNADVMCILITNIHLFCKGSLTLYLSHSKQRLCKYFGIILRENYK